MCKVPPPPVAVPSTAEIWSRSIGGIAGSNPAEVMDVRLVFVLCT